MWSRYARGAVEVRLWCDRGAVEVRLWCGRGVLEVWSRYAHGTVEVRSCASGTLTDAVPVLSCTFNFLSGGTVIVGGASEFIRIIGDPDNRGSDNRGSTVPWKGADRSNYVLP